MTSRVIPAVPPITATVDRKGQLVIPAALVRTAGFAPDQMLIATNLGQHEVVLTPDFSLEFFDEIIARLERIAPCQPCQARDDGTITLPSVTRRFLHLRAGDHVEIEATPRRLVVRTKRAPRATPAHRGKEGWVQ